MAQAAFTDAYVASLQPMYAKLTQQPGALDKVTRRIARAEVPTYLFMTPAPAKVCLCSKTAAGTTCPAM